MTTISARRLTGLELNEALQAATMEGEKAIVVTDVSGHRYIGTGLPEHADLTLSGTPGEDLGAFMDGPTIRVHGNAQNAVGNTMSSGLIAIHGSAGDVLGHSMRGGRIWVRGDVGYRVGIHMKSGEDDGPVIVVGGTAGDFLGEYMAGGVLVVLGLGEHNSTRMVGNWLGTGMHGGAIYVRAEVPEYRIGQGATASPCLEGDRSRLKRHLGPYCDEFGLDLDMVMSSDFSKLVPVTFRPYRRLYVSSVGDC